MAYVTKLIIPNGYSLHRAMPKSAVPAGDGSWWFAQQGHGPRGFGIYVFQQIGGNTAVDKGYGGHIIGTGELVEGGDGQLYLVGNPGDHDAAAAVYSVPGFVPFQRASTGGGVTLPTVDELPNGGKPYRDNFDIGVTGARDPLFYVRFNKLTALVVGLIEELGRNR